MGRDWNHFTKYEVDHHSGIINYLDGDFCEYSYGTSGNLYALLGHFDVLLPVHNTLPYYQHKINDLVSPEVVEKAAEQAIKLLKEQVNPKISFACNIEHLFDEEDVAKRNIQELNHVLIEYMEKIRDLSKAGHYFVLDKE